MGDLRRRDALHARRADQLPPVHPADGEPAEVAERLADVGGECAAVWVLLGLQAQQAHGGHGEHADHQVSERDRGADLRDRAATADEDARADRPTERDHVDVTHPECRRKSALLPYPVVGGMCQGIPFSRFVSRSPGDTAFVAGPPFRCHAAVSSAGFADRNGVLCTHGLCCAAPKTERSARSHGSRWLVEHGVEAAVRPADRRPEREPRYVPPSPWTLRTVRTRLDLSRHP